MKINEGVIKIKKTKIFFSVTFKSLDSGFFSFF